MHETIFFSACDLINLYKSKKLSPVENLKNTFDVIKKLNPKLNAFISIAEKKAMKQAKLLTTLETSIYRAIQEKQ